VSQLDDGGVLPEIGGFLLFDAADLNQVGIRGSGERAGAWSSRTISDHDSRKTIFGMLETGGNSWESENFDVIGMGTDPEMGGGGESGQGIFATWGIEVCGGLREFHRRKTHREAKR
jgi:hypothetical protein